ncbi:glycoside hydrolase family 13 protein [Conidiobolus coronatus NRRL 28638]|uniref:Glycoside hydrolase family 13 protein n=1 Tax=Conidiobolus coronatus (strain ATCC 28846 / CBS 209.66 / NRRL 28638) TaxID=796925 RepID=A0A137P5M9_CONC2|nr:glycoside hydrolase family 13 protein [Conidiobolus coronatus NRRL 28638]|eukprot:KXN70320.1 glycoside hydrolase family 13 protein [Conidiobolus coronatus NRRL 28638]
MKYQQLKIKYKLNKTPKLKSTLKNFTLLQFFEWHLPNTGTHWNTLGEQCKELSDLGITNIWIPPPYKGGSNSDVGYGVYDHWDLGEFYQKGSTRTKYGTKSELTEAIQSCKSYNVTILSDIILNHKMYSDSVEYFEVVDVNPQNRNEEISSSHNILGWTEFKYEGRGGKYSSMKWNYTHFTGVDYDNINKSTGVYKIIGEGKAGWSPNVDKELGNFDYLMGCDIDFQNSEVVRDLNHWGNWMINSLELGGFRLDALKHIDSKFMYNWLDLLLSINDPDLLVIGEYWTTNLDILANYINNQHKMIKLFDVPLHYNLYDASNKRNYYDLTKIFDNTLTKRDPQNSITFVDNHDTQPGQALNSWIQDWFKPHAYALILLRREILYPCVFYGDLYGIGGDNPVPAKHSKTIKRLIHIRNSWAYGDQIDYINHPIL